MQQCISPLFLLLITATWTSHGSIFNLLNCGALKNKKEAAHFFAQQGFEQHWVTTPDGHQLDTIFLSRANAPCTLIVCAGLCCCKEGMAPLYELLPKNYNLLFFDARGHGKSSGSLVRTFWRYGLDEYNDIVAMLNFIQQRSSEPIILYGNCAGGFNACHALLALEKNKRLGEYNIKGFIYDSAWGSRIHASYSGAQAQLNRMAKIVSVQLMGAHYAAKLSTGTGARLLTKMTGALLKVFHTCVCQPFLLPYEKTSNLYDKIGLLPIPVFFIHSYDDTWVSFKEAQRLAQKTKYVTTWWIKEPSRHSCHHVLHPERYKEYLGKFCENTINHSDKK